MPNDQAKRWEYEFLQIGINREVEFQELQRHGDAGWEAVGIAMRGQIVEVLLKRLLPPRRA
jgi:hypothetical protein